METKNLIFKYWREIVIAVLVAMLFLMNRCQPEEKTDVTVVDKNVKIPEIEGEFKKPTKEEELPSKGKDSIIYKDRTIYSTHPLDKKLAQDYLDAQDSISKLQVFLKSIQERDYIHDFSDENLELKIRTSVRGELKEISPKYKIKEREVVVQEKTITKTIIQNDPSGFLLGGGYNHSLKADIDPSFEVNAGVRLKKTNVLLGVNTNAQVSGKILIEF